MRWNTMSKSSALPEDCRTADSSKGRPKGHQTVRSRKNEYGRVTGPLCFFNIKTNIMLLGFKKQFAPKIKALTKIFTIRDERKVTPKVGETIHMYTGLRTKYTELISKEHKYTGSQKVKIKMKFLNALTCELLIYVSDDGITSYRRLTPLEISRFVKHDGFDSQWEFVKYWRKSLKVKSGTISVIRTIYHWTDLRY